MRPPRLLLVCSFLAPFAARAQSPVSATERIPLQYRSPREMALGLNLHTDERTGLNRLDVDPSTDTSAVFVRFNEDTNPLLLTGPAASMPAPRRLIAFADVPPRQIVVEVQIVETNRQVLLDAGLDWQQLLDRTQFNFNYEYRGSSTTNERTTTNRDIRDGDVLNETQTEQDVDNEQNRGDLNLRLSALSSLGEFIHALKQEGAATVRSAPRIVTTNNREGTIIDGSRVGYVANLSAKADTYETEELVTGLTLSVVPSLGESGFVKLDVSAELTSWGRSSARALAKWARCWRTR